MANGDGKIDLTDLRELYHDYSLFGVKNLQLPGVYAPNQAAQSPVIRNYIQLAIGPCIGDEKLTCRGERHGESYRSSPRVQSFCGA
jgi:hypothetical protein